MSKCRICLLLIGFLYISVMIIGYYQMKQIRKMIPKFKIGDTFINNMYEGFTDEQLIKCFNYLHFFENLTISSFLGTEPNTNIPDTCKIQHKKIYENISTAINKMISKNPDCNVITEYKDGITYLYCEFRFNDSNFENTIKNNFNVKTNLNYDDEIEQYYIKSRKDCVEYGLKSPNEEIIVCTKYE